MPTKIVCKKCGRPLSEVNFYTYKDGTKTEMCKQCLTMHIDNFDPQTFLWLLQKMDVPYLPWEWNVLRDRAYQKDPKAMNGMSVFGKYLSKMKLKQWKGYTWADSERLQKEHEQSIKQQQAITEEYEKSVKQQFDKGQISQAQYKTLVDTSYLKRESPELQPPSKQAKDNLSPIGADNAFDEKNFVPQEELPDPAASLTQEDKVYLAMKWGRLYKLNQLVALQRDYAKMQKAYGVTQSDPDTQNTLLLICKTNLKANNAIDHDDVETYQKLCRVSDTLRKSANLTALQNKKDKEHVINSASEIVEYAEKVGGVIPRYKLDQPRDVVDQVILDLKSYQNSLIKEDPALSREIEDYLKKREQAEQQERDKQDAKRKGLDYVPIDDEQLLKHKDFMQKQKEQNEKIMRGEGKRYGSKGFTCS